MCCPTALRLPPGILSRANPGAGKSNSVRWTKHDLPQELIGHGIGSGDINGDGRIDLGKPERLGRGTR